MAKNTKTITCEYYDVHVSESLPDTLTDVLKKLQKDCPEPSQRNWEPIQGEDIFRIDLIGFESQNNSFKGIFRRLRRNYSPRTGRYDSTATRNLELDAGESIIEESAFIYFQNHNVLIRERNKWAGNFQFIAKYLRNKTGYLGILLSFYEKESPASKLKELESLRRLEIAGYSPGYSFLDDNDDDEKSNLDPLDIIQFYSGYKVELKISKIRGKNSVPLEKTKIIKLVEDVSKSFSTSLTKFKVIGDGNDPDEPDFVDFIKNRREFSQTVDAESGNVTDFEKFRIIEAAYAKLVKSKKFAEGEHGPDSDEMVE